jgi:uncharacterized phosphosugar-binding protein
VVDVVIDTGVPAGDVSLTVKSTGGELHIGPLSTMAFVAVANALLLSTIEKLILRGYDVVAFPVRGFDPDADSRMSEILRRHREIYARHLATGD